MFNKFLQSLLLGLLFNVGLTTNILAQDEEATDEATESISVAPVIASPCEAKLHHLETLVRGLNNVSESKLGETGRAFWLWLLRPQHYAYEKTGFSILETPSIKTFQHAALNLIDEVVEFEDSEDAKSCTVEEKQRLDLVIAKADTLHKSFKHADESYITNSVFSGVVASLLVFIAGYTTYANRKFTRLAAAGAPLAPPPPLAPPLAPPALPAISAARVLQIRGNAAGRNTRVLAAQHAADAILAELGIVPTTP